MKGKDNDNNKDKYVPPKEFRTIYKGTYSQPLQRMWRIIYDDGRLPIEERETFLEEYTLKGKTDFNCTDWYSPDNTEHTDCYHPDCIKPGWKRNISYIMDINSPIGPKHTRTSAEEEIQVFEPKKIIFQSTSSTPDVPYGSSFNTIIIQCLYEDEETHETSFEVYGYIHWTGSCVIKKSVEKFAFSGMTDHQKEMDEALKNYIKENPNPKYSENTTKHITSPILSNSQPLECLENDQTFLNFSVLVDINDDSQNTLLHDLSNNEDMTTLNNNLVYDNILEKKEKELEKKGYLNKDIYCSSLANTFNTSFLNISEFSVFKEKTTKLKHKSDKFSESIKWIFSIVMLIIFFILTFKVKIYEY
ncbi:hypothetical protein BCR36DRAFT_358606 [Piromyces finnis]|uniref:VASt domain-containing protein n=1 Tax=Piromyces finnis TaxID=1754191 RepID=A0A1Y1V2J3_9FUNG|nr:hypothetical protein BCR36DRAFT_358606 [Piromyces finnis]|eukprot:ORX45176.1 hypothetical protein BCR36DRAFT_358606 [Piromyces finnis]